jgi:hypothetical protein
MHGHIFIRQSIFGLLIQGEQTCGDRRHGLVLVNHFVHVIG